MYPLFLRTAPSDLLMNRPRFALMATYDWCYVATLHQTANLFSLAVQDFHESFKSTLGTGPTGTCSGRADNDNPVLFSFTGDPQIPLMQIKSKKIRIIYGFFYEDKAVLVMCYARKLGLTTNNHLWILPGWFSESWMDSANTLDWSPYNCSCNSDEIMEAAKYSLLVDAFSQLTDATLVSDSGYTNASYFKEYYSRRDSYFNITNATPSYDIPIELSSNAMYDAVWATALSLNATETKLQSMGRNLSEFEYSDSTFTFLRDTFSSNISKMVTENMKNLDFIGVSGRVTFDGNGTRLTYTQISQYVPGTRMINGTERDVLNTVRLAIYNETETGLDITYVVEPKWRLGRPPTDRSRPVSILISPAVIYTMDTVLAIGIIIAVVLLVFQIVTIRKPLMANSAPYINIILIIGCIVMMGSSILLGIDSGTPQVTDGDRDKILDEIGPSAKNRYAIICMTRVWLLTIGFTLSFGSLFAKTWQVYRVYTKADLGKQPFKMWNFFIIMAIQLTIDAIFLSIWIGVFRFSHRIYEEDNEAENAIRKHEYCYCDNFSYLVGSLYVYKGLLVVFGLFLAYESRNVKYTFINDSRFVSIAMYIVVVLIAISAPLSLVLADQHFIIDPSYAIAVLLIFITCMSCLMILYIPKFYYLAKGADTMVPSSKNEAFLPVDNLQLGHTDVNPEDVQSAEQKIKQLKEQVKQREIELLSLARRASDQDSGVLCASTEDTGADGSNRGSESPATMQTLQDTVTTVSSEGNGGDTINNNDVEEEENEGEREGERHEKLPQEMEEGRQEKDVKERGDDDEEDINVAPLTRKKTVTIADVEEIEL
ncbi:PREDICTED: gamma-aminobutyric acid type B receptor subunit 1-like [Amphimedon queenslandica]|uniref:G-protein coupled receptors family 3 profile domain-containing protein n=1 Tax=Amphimedon queenslandica TaxID=400682 RepID=A0AAN0JH72_AMPQE|nr:PREDICTED: gamma-aminobutyric acid type B receptor subunit 1-like [Amphimedon queenslandica]|eukprot:XP_019856013.1 PREDICTED: gamma-aminobutyric acid type B receptor subunit 1-like [Amphimedon queenslandica]